MLKGRQNRQERNSRKSRQKPLKTNRPKASGAQIAMVRRANHPRERRENTEKTRKGRKGIAWRGFGNRKNSCRSGGQEPVSCTHENLKNQSTAFARAIRRLDVHRQNPLFCGSNCRRTRNSQIWRLLVQRMFLVSFPDFSVSTGVRTFCSTCCNGYSD